MNTEPTNELDDKTDFSAKGIWQQLPGESTDSHSAFVSYLRLGFDATLSDVAESTGRSYKAIKHLSWRHKWLERAAAWRQHLDVAALTSLEGENLQAQKLWATRLETTRQRRWDRLQKLDMVCDQALNKLVSNPDAEVAPYELAGMLRLTGECEDRAIAHVPEPEVTPDKSSDPIIRQFHAYAAKVTAHRKKSDVPPAQPAPTQPTPDAAA